MEIPISEEQICRRLKSVESHPPDNPYPNVVLPGKPKPAAVLVPLLQVDQAWHLLFIRRAHKKNDPHSGQVAFPGGLSEPLDVDRESTALREAFEEIGLAPHDVRVLGRMNEHHSVTNFTVTPIVGIVPWPYSFRVQITEVTRYFTIPLSWLADPNNHQLRYRRLADAKSEVPVIYFRDFNGETLWGATARITTNLITTLAGDH